MNVNRTRAGKRRAKGSTFTCSSSPPRDRKSRELPNSAGGGSDLREATLPLARHRQIDSREPGKDARLGVLDTLRIFCQLNFAAAKSCDVGELADLIPSARWPQVFFDGKACVRPHELSPSAMQTSVGEQRLVTFSPALPGSGDGTIVGWKQRRPLHVPGTITSAASAKRRLDWEETARSVDQSLSDAAFVERLF